jgi:hypothetical protein
MRAGEGGFRVNTILERSMVQRPLQSLAEHVMRKANLCKVAGPRLDGIPPASGYRIGGVSLSQLIDAVNSFGERFAVCSESNKFWEQDARVEKFSTRESPTFYPLHPADFRRHIQSFSFHSSQEQEEVCKKNGGQMASVEEVLDFLIDYLAHTSDSGLSPFERLNELIPSSTDGERRTCVMIRCRNMLYPQNSRWSLCVKLLRDASVSIVDWPLWSATADVGSLCTWRI